MQKSVPEPIVQPKKALSKGMLSQIIDYMVPDDPEEDYQVELVCRDIMVLVFGFLGCQQVHVCRLNLQDVCLDLEENRIQADIYGGKTSKFQGKQFFVSLFQPKLDVVEVYNSYKAFIEKLYGEGFHTEDESCKTFLVTVNRKQNSFNDARMTTKVDTTILKERLKNYCPKA